MTEYAQLPTTLFLDGLDTYVRRYLKSRGDYSRGLPLDQPGGQTELEKATLDVAEALLLADGVALKTTGENVALAFVARMFGAHAAADLVRRGAIEFVGQANEAGALVDPSAVKQEDGSSVPPGNPIIATFLYDKSEPHVFPNGSIDGEAAATLALRRYQTELGLEDREVRELSRRAAKRTHAIPPNRLADVVRRVGSAYASGALAAFGLSPEIAREKNEYQDPAYLNIITHIMYAEMFLDLDLNQYQMPDAWSEIRKFTAEVSSGNEVLRSVDQITELRGIADIRSLFRDRVLKVEDIPALRSHSATVSFRRWLWSKPDPRDAAAIARDFVGEVSGRNSSSLQGYLTRSARIVGISVIHDAALAGMNIPAAAGVAVSAGVALLSDSAIEHFKRRPPSAFFDEVLQPAIASSRRDLN